MTASLKDLNVDSELDTVEELLKGTQAGDEVENEAGNKPP